LTAYIGDEIYFDAGLAIAESQLDFTDYVRPICLPTQPVDKVSISSTFLRTNFSNEHRFGSFFCYTCVEKGAKMTFVQKMRA
jgi:hypothetical protein